MTENPFKIKNEVNNSNDSLNIFSSVSLSDSINIDTYLNLNKIELLFTAYSDIKINEKYYKIYNLNIFDLTENLDIRNARIFIDTYYSKKNKNNFKIDKENCNIGIVKFNENYIIGIKFKKNINLNLYLNDYGDKLFEIFMEYFSKFLTSIK